jgi:cobyrinic acid a,c-diamide synthase
LVLDDAFHFYYQDGIDYLTALGARIVPCSALQGNFPDDLDGLYIGGGFPEMFADEISRNKDFLAGVRAGHRQGLPVYAECGGMMLLSKAIVDLEGREFPMAGIVPGKTVMLKKRAGLGYVTAFNRRDNILASAGKMLRGHEFHYSILEGLEMGDYAFSLERPGEASRMDGYCRGSLLASYLHLHFCGCREEALCFIKACLDYRKKRKASSL